MSRPDGSWIAELGRMQTRGSAGSDSFENRVVEPGKLPMTFNQWACAGQGGLPTFRRAVGVLLLLIGPQVFFWSHGGPGPFHVPAWRIGRTVIDLPLPPAAIDVAAWAAYAV